MILGILAAACLLATIRCQRPTLSSGYNSRPPPATDEPYVCLTGQMSDIQSWVDDTGAIVAIKGSRRAAIDLSSSCDPASVLQQAMTRAIRMDKRSGRVRFLSMARCQLTSVPQVFNFKDCKDRPLSETLQYVTFFGNQFHDFGPPGQHYDVTINATDATNLTSSIAMSENRERSRWDVGFRNVKFPKLLELYLRSCHIQHLSDGIFEGMPSLKSLYLNENKITYISANAFFKLDNLIHLDLSHNSGSAQDGIKIPLSWESDDVFSHLPNLTSLDLSLTLLSPNGVAVFYSLGRSFQRLSLCYTGLDYLKSFSFKNTQLRFLDLSGNRGIIHDPRSLDGLQKSLQVLYADRVTLKSLESLVNFEALEILKLSNNELSFVDAVIAETWHSLRILDLGNNRLSSWMEKVYSKMSNLEILSLRNNNINMINLLMLQDIRNVSYLALSGNFFVCTCYKRELFEIAANNEKINGKNTMFHYHSSDRVTDYHTGYSDYYSQIINRTIVERNCEKDKFCRHEVNADINGTFRLFDYDSHLYECYMIDEVFTLEFAQVDLCNISKKDIYENYIKGGWTKVIIIAMVATVCVPLLILGFVFRRSFRYFYVTMKNSALLSMMDESKSYKDGSIFNYDVFVSYCNEDRPWVLDQLLPHVEKDCNISVCLHERDFQVGLSILENIVSCMDRSRSIMLIISQRFLLSQWCQFEMHLAQHRLLETRREDLILILLEDIPRRLRPNTLHYLMLTKTYVVWPKDPAEQVVFWKRLRKSLVTRKLKQTNNVSLA